MQTIPQYICAVIPDHMLSRVATQGVDEARDDARATLEHMRELATGKARTLLAPSARPSHGPPPRYKFRNVYDARHSHTLPGTLVVNHHKPRSADVEANEAYDGCGLTYDFFAEVFGRKSIDDRGMRLDSTVHYGTRFENAMWNGRQMVYGDGDGHIFNRFTASVSVIAHELMHGITQHAAALGYDGQTGALNEHLSDAFGIMVRQYQLGQSAHESDWLIGAELFGPAVRGGAIRSMAAPGTAYDHPILGRDPQPSHMLHYVHTADDHGGVHINSGILNRVFYRVSMAIGGKTWEGPGRLWYAAVNERLHPEADFHDFAVALIDLAGELFGYGGRIQRIVEEALDEAGL